MRSALFLDRDGVINVDIHHLYRIEDCVFRHGIFDIVKDYCNRGYVVIIVTNQAGIAKKLYSEQDYFTLRNWMHGQFADHGIQITAEYYCPHHPDFTGPCPCRKPEPGMILRAALEHDLDLASSVLIGDKQSDMEAGRRAGVGTVILSG